MGNKKKSIKLERSNKHVLKNQPNLKSTNKKKPGFFSNLLINRAKRKKEKELEKQKKVIEKEKRRNEKRILKEERKRQIKKEKLQKNGDKEIKINNNISIRSKDIKKKDGIRFKFKEGKKGLGKKEGQKITRSHIDFFLIVEIILGLFLLVIGNFLKNYIIIILAGLIIIISYLIHRVKVKLNKKKVKTLNIQPQKKFMINKGKPQKEKLLKGNSVTDKNKDVLIKQKKSRLLTFIFILIFLVGVGLLVVGISYYNIPTIILALILILLAIITYKLKNPRIKRSELMKKYTRSEEVLVKQLNNIIKKESDISKEKDKLDQDIEHIIDRAKEIEKKEIELKLISKSKDSPKKIDLKEVERLRKPLENNLSKRSLKLSNLETDLDAFYSLVNRKGSVKLSEFVTYFKVDIKLIENWGKILEARNLIKLHYPAFGELQFRRVEEEKDQENKQGKDHEKST
ncbi:MAG: hypothetical protein ABII01_07360 [Candidatus Woesearchaeota archaeon]